ncbi:conserved hypothetical protein [Neospora caninum Liverpool]|uniref:WDHD1/CFT4 second beta-propeller domain-containing protein n=1 Tax=Neospora caninum (strain Liverpool) TaxID=572307 RepID=F0VN83_NEOCL|nr:conserved hypothetical protein [Neospora caninum Liverpool]CBZ55179.1 conserved hypothetical protein [Neospora caninum Liverpool]CEL69906.1 TPA: hypothetical protein BN1204_056040 [Neospora caninum Liverpool]|eukprot:XP_003885207.1 conserved hypothetical protein [Neospora caninum Liverpool]
MASPSGHGVPSFRLTSWHSPSTAPRVHSPAATGSVPRLAFVPGPPLVPGGSCSLLTYGSQTSVTRLQPLFRQDGVGRAEKPSSEHCSATFSVAGSATIAVAQSAGSPVVAVAPVHLYASRSDLAETAPLPDREQGRERSPAAFPLVVGLENGQVWLYEWQQAGQADPSAEAACESSSPAAPKCVAKQLLCRHMARPVTLCVARLRRGVAGADSMDDEAHQDHFEVYVLYSNGMVVVWKKGRRNRIELGPVEGGVHMSVDPEGRYIAVASSTRKLFVFRRKDSEVGDDAVTFTKCFDQEIFRKQLNSACAVGAPLQTAWHPNGTCLFLPGAASVRVLKTATMTIEPLEFASSGFDPLVVFDKVAIVPLTACGPPGPPESGRESSVLLASVRSTVRAWNLDDKQPLFCLDADKASSSSSGDRLLHLAAWASTLRNFNGGDDGQEAFSPLIEVGIVRDDGAISVVGIRSERLLKTTEKETITALGSNSGVDQVEQVKQECAETQDDGDVHMADAEDHKDEPKPEGVATKNKTNSSSASSPARGGMQPQTAESVSRSHIRANELSPARGREGGVDESLEGDASGLRREQGEDEARRGAAQPGDREIAPGTPEKRKHGSDGEAESETRWSGASSRRRHKGEKKEKRRKERKSAAVSTPVRRFIEMQAEEGSEEGSEDEEQLFGDGPGSGSGDEEGAHPRGPRDREKRKRDTHSRRPEKKRRRTESQDGDDGSASSDSQADSDFSESSAADAFSSSDDEPAQSSEDEGESLLDEQDEEEASAHTLLSSSSFLTKDTAAAETLPAADSPPEAGGAKDLLLENMRKILLQMHAKQKESRREQHEAKQRARRLQKENTKLQAELRRLRRTHQALLTGGALAGGGDAVWAVERAVSPGACRQPGDAATPWCLFWNQHGHVTKVTSGDKTTLEIFNFSPVAAISGTSRKRITDYTNACMASLSKVGVALASVGSKRPLLPSRVEFRSLQDSSQWTKTLPVPERPLGVAVGDSFVAVVTSADLLRVFATSGIALSLSRLPGVPVAICASHQLLFVVVATTAAALGSVAAAGQSSRQNGRLSGQESRYFFHCLLLHVHPPPASPSAAYLLPFGCRDRVMQLPGLMAKAVSPIDVIHEGPLVLDYPLDWVNISPGGMPSVKDISGRVWGLLPAWGRAIEGPVPYSLSWLPLVNLREAAGGSLEDDAPPPSVKFWPLYVDESKGEIMVIRLKASKPSPASSDADASENGLAALRASPTSSLPPDEPSCAQASPMFGYTLEQLPLRLPFTDVWPYMRWRQLLLKDKNLKGIVQAGKKGEGASGAAVTMGEAALVPWHQFDEMRWRNEVVMRLMCIALRNWEGGGAGGGAGGPENQQEVLKMEQSRESLEAEKRFTTLMKNHDKFALREFLVCREDRRLHSAALDVALRFKMATVAAHARESLDGDTRMQSEKLREALEWQAAEGHVDGIAGVPAALPLRPLESEMSQASRAFRAEAENQKPETLYVAHSKRRTAEGSEGAESPEGRRMKDSGYPVPGSKAAGKMHGLMEAPAPKSWMRGGSRGPGHQKFSAFRQAAD